MFDDSEDFFQASTGGVEPRAVKVTLARVCGIEEGRTYRTVPFSQHADTSRDEKPRGTKRRRGA